MKTQLLKQRVRTINCTIPTFALLALTALQSVAQSTYEPYTFTTLAGGAGFSSPEQPGTAVRFRVLAGIALDSSGNIYAADTFNHAIRKLTPVGTNWNMQTLAGLPGTSGSADGTGSDARFFLPYDLRVDRAGNIYVTGDAHTIRKVTPEGVVTTIAGLADTPGSRDGVGSAARFNITTGVAVDSAGNVYVADYENHTIRKLSPVGTNWVVTTIAGLAGNPGSANGTNRAARFWFPHGLAIDGAGNLYVPDMGNHTIRKLTPVGTNWVVTTLAGRAGVLGNADGTNSAARFYYPHGVSVDSAGTLYVADLANETIRRVTPIGTNWVVTTLAGLAAYPDARARGTVDGIGNTARFYSPSDVEVDSSGTLYVADTDNTMIRKMTLVGTNWMVTTLAGLGGNYGSTDGAANAALFKGPAAVTVDSAGNTYVAEEMNQTIRKVTPAGEVTTIAGLAGYGGTSDGTNSAARFLLPSGIAADSAGNLYVADKNNVTIRKVTLVGTNWVVTTLAGLADNFGSTDGTGSAARFDVPSGLALDSAGNLYVADIYNNTIRRVTPTGSVTTRAGLAGTPGSADGTGATARFNRPYGVAVDSATNIYVADTWNHTIRKITPARVVTTLAGQAGSPGSADGIGNAARFNYPSAIAADNAGNVYVADTYNNTIRKLTQIGTNWVVTTLGGMSGLYGTADGTGSTARFSNPSGVAVDSDGTIYVADFYFNTIRKGYPPPKMLNAGFVGVQFRFDLTGPPGRSVIVETSPDLVSWLPVWTNTSTLNFSDPQSSVTAKRFYRARLP